MASFYFPPPHLSSPLFLLFPLSFLFFLTPSLSLLLSHSVPLFPYTPHYQFISSQQLAPTVQGSESAHENGLEQTLFERLAFMVRSDSIPCVCCFTSGPVSHSPFHSTIGLYLNPLFSNCSFLSRSSTPVSSTTVLSTQLFASICSIVMIYQFLSSSFSTPSLLSLSFFLSLFFFPLLLTFSSSSFFPHRIVFTYI